MKWLLVQYDTDKDLHALTVADPEEIVIDYSDMRLRYVLIKDCHPYPEMRLDLCKECRVNLYEWIKKGGAE